MNKADFVKAVAEGTEFSQKDVETIVNKVFDVITNTIKTEPITFVGFGTFGSSVRNQRTARNPQTGEEMIIPSKRVPTFKAGKHLKESMM